MSTFNMSALTDPIGTAKAQIQAYVGTFLQLKAKLMPLTTSTDYQTAQTAQQYLNVQEQLEAQLPGMLNIANSMTAADAFSANGIQLGTFATQLVNHVNAVNSFLGPAQAIDVQISTTYGFKNTDLVIGAAIMVLGVAMDRTMLGVIGGVGYVLASKMGVVNLGV